MSLRIEEVRNPNVSISTQAQFAEDTNTDYFDENPTERILVLDYDEVVIISGDLEKFAKRVWALVMGSDHPEPADETREATPTDMPRK